MTSDLKRKKNRRKNKFHKQQTFRRFRTIMMILVSLRQEIKLKIQIVLRLILKMMMALVILEILVELKTRKMMLMTDLAILMVLKTKTTMTVLVTFQRVNHKHRASPCP